MDNAIIIEKPRTLKRLGGNPKLYVLSIIINSPLEENDMIELSESFINSIPHTDMTYNLQYADHKKITKNNRSVRIG